MDFVLFFCRNCRPFCAAFTFFCSSGVFCSGRFLFASVSFSMVELSTGSAPSDFSGLEQSAVNVVSTLIVSSDFFPCTTSGAFLLKQKTGFPPFRFRFIPTLRFGTPFGAATILCAGVIWIPCLSEYTLVECVLIDTQGFHTFLEFMSKNGGVCMVLFYG